MEQPDIQSGKAGTPLCSTYSKSVSKAVTPDVIRIVRIHA